MSITPTGLQTGAALAPTVYRTSKVQVFRFSAATWNTHRIHYEKDYAGRRGISGRARPEPPARRLSDPVLH